MNMLIYIAICSIALSAFLTFYYIPKQKNKK